MVLLEFSMSPIAKGVVKTDVNLGSGYAYKVLVEDVSFQK